MASNNHMEGESNCIDVHNPLLFRLLMPHTYAFWQDRALLQDSSKIERVEGTRVALCDLE